MSQKILIVDEKLFMLRLIQHHLKKAGYELIQARNGVEAIAAMAEHDPTMVLMDDGAELQVKQLCRNIKTRKRRARFR